VIRDKINCVFLTGPSGVGKSTVLRACLSYSWPNNIQVKLLKKFTTRMLRDNDERLELIHLAREEFAKRQEAGEFLLHYPSYQELYALENEAFKVPSRNTLYIQALPTSAALEVRQKLNPPWIVNVCQLQADEQKIRERLLRRGDNISLRQMVDRAKGSKKLRNKQADTIIDSNLPPIEVVEQLKSWLYQ
jgi:guanylate kinase